MAPQSPRPRLPIGISDFREMREPGMIYVDKTNFVTQVLVSGPKVLLFPRPRRFGKTLNLSAVRYFVEKSQEDRSALFEGLSVWGSAEAREHFQRYPVISLTFKDVKAPSFEEAFAAMRREISGAFRQHAYLLEGGTLRPEQADDFRRILRAEGPVDLYGRSLLELSMYLAQHHKQGAFILIDEYDTPIHAAGSPEDERRILDFFRVFLSGGLKDNPHLHKGVVTGILRIAKESLFSGLNNLAVYSLIRSEHATSFGFTQQEVNHLAEVTGSTEHLPEMERWYNGYRFSGEVIYNPWSIINFLDSPDKTFRPYWIQTSSEGLLRRVIFAHGIGQDGELETLLQGGQIHKTIHDRVALRDLGASSDAVWSFLLFTGYLKAVDVRQDDLYTVADLSIPNREVLTVYHTIFKTWLEQRLDGSRHVDDLLKAILAGDADECERLFGLLLESFSMHDLAPRRRGFDPDAEVVLTPEQVYHIFVVSLLLNLQPRYSVRSNRESGSGRYDVMVLPKSPGQPGAVLELKVLNRRKRETMKSGLTAALRQIHERGYAAELRAAGASPIHEIAVAFDGKQVRVAVAKPPKRAPASVRQPGPRGSKPVRKAAGRASGTKARGAKGRSA
jgi:Predicted AAA-ATPase/PD-(D/E)XK nuclease superfamily